MKGWMNRHGGYIHKIPQKKVQAPGFQIGALASQLPALSWSVIADAQLQAGKRSDIDTQTTFDNSIRGLPYKRRQIIKEDFEKLKLNHIWNIPPNKDNIQMVFITADTQEQKSVYGVFAMDKKDNIFLLKQGQVRHMWLEPEQRQIINRQLQIPVKTLEDIIQSEYLDGIKPLFAVIDRQGHRSQQVEYFSKRNNKVIMWQGTKMESQRFKLSNNNEKLYLVAARHYQAQLIHYLYTQKNREQNYLYFYPQITDECIKQILSFKPDNGKKWGDLPQNWQAVRHT